MKSWLEKHHASGLFARNLAILCLWNITVQAVFLLCLGLQFHLNVTQQTGVSSVVDPLAKQCDYNKAKILHP